MNPAISPAKTKPMAISSQSIPHSDHCLSASARHPLHEVACSRIVVFAASGSKLSLQDCEQK